MRLKCCKHYIYIYSIFIQWCPKVVTVNLNMLYSIFFYTDNCPDWRLLQNMPYFFFFFFQSHKTPPQHLITKGMDVHVSDDEIENLFETLKYENINLNEIEIILPKIE